MCVSCPDPAALGFIISPWSLLLMPSGSISFTDENVTQQDLRAFTAPELLEGLTLASVSDIEKVRYSGLAPPPTTLLSLDSVGLKYA